MKITRDSVYNFLNSSRWTDSAALFLRVFAGGMLLSHGIMKIQNWDFLTGAFPPMLGMGSTLSLVMATLVEVGCSIAIICGFLTRLALIPAIFTMLVAVLFGHPGEFGELPFIYMGIFVALFISGPGMYALDRWLFVPKAKKSEPRHAKQAELTDGAPTVGRKAGGGILRRR